MTLPFKVNLSGKTAAVTGGTGVLCGCMAKALGECGAAVAIAGRRKNVADSMADEIRRKGGRAVGVSCNVLDKKSLEEADALIEKELGPIDILINGAGGNSPKGTTSAEYLNPDELKNAARRGSTFYDLTLEGFQEVFNLNLIGTFLPIQVFTRSMALRKKGVVINIASMSAYRPLTKIPAYSAAKAAVVNLTQWLAVYLSKSGIRINAIAPGFFLTEQNRSLLTESDGSLTPRGETILAHTPMRKFGEPPDLIGTMLWLASDDAAGFVTGAVIPVDGGFAAFSGV